MLVLTPQGKKTLDALFKEVSAIEAPIREELGDADMQRFIAFVDRAVQALDAKQE